jgi:hypothetical protein
VVLPLATSDNRLGGCVYGGHNALAYRKVKLCMNAVGQRAMGKVGLVLSAYVPCMLTVLPVHGRLVGPSFCVLVLRCVGCLLDVGTERQNPSHQFHVLLLVCSIPQIAKNWQRSKFSATQTHVTYFLVGDILLTRY